MAIKGVNKQIIEIKCTDNEYFEKALLFVKGNGNYAERNILVNMGKNYIAGITDSATKKNSARGKKGAVTAVISCVVALIMIAVMIVFFL